VDVDLPKLIERFGNEDKCHAYLEELRWPDGVECPRCGSDKISRIKERRQFDCDGCRYQFSVRVGTLFHDSKLPLWKWFLAVYLLCESKKGMSAAQLGRTLGVSAKTGWYLCHRIRAAMSQEGEAPLSGVVEADETYLGGKLTRTFPARNDGRPGPPRGTNWRDNKTVVLGAVERGGRVRLQVAPNAEKRTIHKFIEGVVSPDADLYTDDLRSYDGLPNHEAVRHTNDEWVRGQIHSNTAESVFSLFDRAVIGSYHKLSVKHLPAYLDEFAFRWNNRRNPYMFRDTILALVEGDALPYKALTGA